MVQAAGGLPLDAWRCRYVGKEGGSWARALHRRKPGVGVERPSRRGVPVGCCKRRQEMKSGHSKTETEIQRVQRKWRGAWASCLVACVMAAVWGCGRTEAAGTAIPHGTVELMADKGSIAAGRTVTLGLRFELEKGWHIYWINPGDSGEPPKVKWELPAGLSAGAIEWPAPKRLGTASVRDFGYEDGVTLLVPMHAEESLRGTQTAQIVGNVSLLVCREMCIPGKAQVSLTLPIRAVAPATDNKTKELFIATRKSLPRVTPASWKFRATDTSGAFVLTGMMGRPVKQATFYPLVESQIDNAAEQKMEPAAGGFRLTLKKSDQLLKPIDKLKGVLELGEEEAYTIDAPVGKGIADAEEGKYESEK
jgi:DsbC/DsbD-like thiol-disulfide interchange protein